MKYQNTKNQETKKKKRVSYHCNQQYHEYGSTVLFPTPFSFFLTNIILILNNKLMIIAYPCGLRVVPVRLWRNKMCQFMADLSFAAEVWLQHLHSVRIKLQNCKLGSTWVTGNIWCTSSSSSIHSPRHGRSNLKPRWMPCLRNHPVEEVNWWLDWSIKWLLGEMVTSVAAKKTLMPKQQNPTP